MPCEACRASEPTQYVCFRQIIGMILARQTSEVRGNLCRNCVWRSFRTLTLTTLLWGWWAPLSFFMTPFIILRNVVEFIEALLSWKD